jgi:hypothetical protein
VQNAAGGVQVECSCSVGSGLHRLELYRAASDAWWKSKKRSRWQRLMMRGDDEVWLRRAVVEL